MKHSTHLVVVKLLVISVWFMAFSPFSQADEKPADQQPPDNVTVKPVNPDHREPPYQSKAPIEALKDRFKEPLLDSVSMAGKEVYRFTLMPTFDKPLTIRLNVLNEESGEIVIKKLSGEGGYELGKLSSEKTIFIEGEEFKALIATLRKPEVTQPYGDLTESQLQILSGLDGAMWYFEARRGDRYACADVWTPEAVISEMDSILKIGGAEYKKLNLQPFIDACRALDKAANVEKK